MKKWLKISLFSLLGIFLVSAGVIYYFLEVKQYETADAEVEEITNSEYEVVLPEPLEEEVSVVASAEEESNEKQDGSESESTSTMISQSNDDTSSKTTKPKENSSTSIKNNSTSTTQVTVAHIKKRYEPSFSDLQSKANGKIDSLVGKAFGEYKQKKANGESISYSYFYSKYKGAADNLEANTDAAFQQIYAALENELKSQGFSPSHAEGFKAQYEEAKNARQSALLAKAREAL